MLGKGKRVDVKQAATLYNIAKRWEEICDDHIAKNNRDLQETLAKRDKFKLRVLAALLSISLLAHCFTIEITF